jgi:hypothetical protein
MAARQTREINEQIIAIEINLLSLGSCLVEGKE